MASRDWEVAPAFSEQIYTMEDALLFAGMLMAMVKNCERVKIACQSLLTNISAAIMTKTGGEVWVQPIFYPFSYMSKYGRGVLLESVLKCPQYQSKKGNAIPYLDQLAVYNPSQEEIVFFVVNRRGEASELTLEMQGFEITDETLEQVMLYHDDLKANNQDLHENVVPSTIQFKTENVNSVECRIQPFSWNMLRVKVRTGDE